MLRAFFRLAAQNPARQRAFRRAVAVHLAVLLCTCFILCENPARGAPLLAYVLLTTSICEGAFLVGWRLTQIPKSLALEYLLASPVSSRRIFQGEALVAATRLVLVTLSGLPVLLLLAQAGLLRIEDVPVLLLLPLEWGLVIGLGITWWVYEPVRIRRWGERFALGSVMVYLAIGVLAGEQLFRWLRLFPTSVSDPLLFGFEALHRFNPFAILRFWLEADSVVAAERLILFASATAICLLLVTIRASHRFKGHFDELHYLPCRAASTARSTEPGDHPLTWWAVRRVSSYSGRVNLWLAGGVGSLYAVYLLAGASWPAWLGRSVFEMFDKAGGVATLTTALVVLAAVPAAFQYGLWDSDAGERCRKLELLLLTSLSGIDFWRAASAAAWKRGRGYFLVAVMLWAAQVIAQPSTFLACLAALATGTVVWGLYFAVGFRAFTRGSNGANLGLALTVWMPLVAFGLYTRLSPNLAALIPPGSVYCTSSSGPGLYPALGITLAALLALYIGRRALGDCQSNLQTSYARQSGSMQPG